MFCIHYLIIVIIIANCPSKGLGENHDFKKKKRSRGQIGDWQLIIRKAEDRLKGRLDTINQDESGKIVQPNNKLGADKEARETAEG